MMKKKLILALAVCAMAVMATACGSKPGGAETTAAATTAAGDTKETTLAGESSSASGESAAEKETTTVGETAETGPEVGPGMADDASLAVVENQNLADLENSDYAGFAKQVVDAVTAKDINALADLMAYPAYVSCVKENEGIVDTKDGFLALDQEELFDESLIGEMKKADLGDLTPLMAGIVIGEDTPNIIFNMENGKLGITGINY